MGFFDFVKNAGEKLFGGGKEAEEKSNKEREEAIAKQIYALGFKVEGLRVSYDDGTVTLSGAAESQEVKEKVILVAGNTHGVGRVDDRMTISEPPAVFYTVASGDSLSKIAKAHYGDPMKYPVIFEANKPMLAHPDKIYPGQVLRIPPIKD
jgi:nucleoid-associated protein YgaU